MTIKSRGQCPPVRGYPKLRSSPLSPRYNLRKGKAIIVQCVIRVACLSLGLSMPKFLQEAVNLNFSKVFGLLIGRYSRRQFFSELLGSVAHAYKFFKQLCFTLLEGITPHLKIQALSSSLSLLSLELLHTILQILISSFFLAWSLCNLITSRE